MALPAGAATATITVGVSTDIAGTAGTITGLAVRPECRLVWAATGQPIEDWDVGAIDADAATLVVLADQDGVVTSGTVAGAPALVAIRSWPMVAVWRVKSAGGQRRKIVRRFPASLLTAGGTLDLDLLPAHGAVPPAQITYAQTIMAGSAYQAAVLAGYTGTEEEWAAGLATERMDAIAAADRAEAAANEARGLITSAVRASYDPGTDAEVLTLSIPTGMIDPLDPLILLLPVEVS